MKMICTVRPVVPAVDLLAARRNLRVDGDYMDDQIADWVAGITARLEHAVGQRFMEQTWEVRLSSFPAGRAPIELPHPAMEVVSIKYLDEDDAITVVPLDDYRLEVVQYESILRPRRGAVWPTVPDDAHVMVTVKCGYGNTPEKTPPTARLFILGKLVEQYDPETKAERDTKQSLYLDGLIDDLKTYA